MHRTGQHTLGPQQQYPHKAFTDHGGEKTTVKKQPDTWLSVLSLACCIFRAVLPRSPLVQPTHTNAKTGHKVFASSVFSDRCSHSHASSKANGTSPYQPSYAAVSRSALFIHIFLHCTLLLWVFCHFLGAAPFAKTDFKFPLCFPISIFNFPVIFNCMQMFHCFYVECLVPF